MNEVFKLLMAALRYGAAARRRWPLALFCLLLAVPCAIGAVGCGFAALWIYLAPRVGAAAAPLIVALVLVILAAALILIGKRMLRPGRARPGRGGSADVLSGEIARLAQEHKGMTLLISILAGLIAGNERRRK